MLIAMVKDPQCSQQDRRKVSESVYVQESRVDSREPNPKTDFDAKLDEALEKI